MKTLIANGTVVNADGSQVADVLIDGETIAALGAGLGAVVQGVDRVIDARVLPDGSIKIRNAVQSRQRTRLEGTPPQRDGFEPDFRGAREIDLLMQCPPDEPGVLRGQFCSEIGGNVYSKATGKWSR